MRIFYKILSFKCLLLHLAFVTLLSYNTSDDEEGCTVINFDKTFVSVFVQFAICNLVF